MNGIIWKGVSSTTIQGLLISELPPITKPEMRIRETEIEGRDGSIIEELGYSSYVKTVKIGLHGNFDINKVIKYFTGEGDIVFSNEPDKIYKAKICGKIDYTRLLRYRQASIPFLVQPFKYKLNEYLRETQTATVSGTNIMLNDSGNTPLQITTEAEEVIVHGKNIVNAYSFDVGANKSLNVYDEGYKIVVVGGTNGTNLATRLYLPMHTKGKTYTLKCDDILADAVSYTSVQVKIITDSDTKYYTLFSNGENKSIDFVVPEDATSVGVGIYTNPTNTVLPTDNTATVLGLRIVPVEFKNEDWCAFSGIQTLKVVNGVATGNAYAPATVVLNADNLDMSVEYFKAFEVFNEGLENSEPLIILKGRGTVEMSVNGTAKFSYTFPEGEDEVYIDSEKEDAYLGDVLKNRNMNGEFPVLIPKTNIIEWSGDVESISILPRSRWL